MAIEMGESSSNHGDTCGSRDDRCIVAAILERLKGGTGEEPLLYWRQNDLAAEKNQIAHAVDQFPHAVVDPKMGSMGIGGLDPDSCERIAWHIMNRALG